MKGNRRKCIIGRTRELEIVDFGFGDLIRMMMMVMIMMMIDAEWSTYGTVWYWYARIVRSE